MKTKEFIKQIVNLEFRIETTHANIEICDRNYTELATVRHDEMFGIVTGLNSYNEMPSEIQHKLFNLLAEYASTPLEEREEEKKYYLRHRNLDYMQNYLNFNIVAKEYSVSYKDEDYQNKTKFKLSELPHWIHTMLEQGHLVKEEVE